VASYRHHLEIVELLIDHGAKLAGKESPEVKTLFKTKRLERQQQFLSTDAPW
jgi:hypothetical protein